MLFGPTIFFSKAAIFLMYHQLFSVHVWIRKGVVAGLVFAFLTYFPGIPLCAYFMTPWSAGSWENLPFTHDGSRGMIPWGIAVGCLSIVLDLYIFALPMPILMKLNLPLHKRIQLIAVFATAVL
jgi:hypothetical protein